MAVFLVNTITEQSLTDPLEVLRFFQKNLVKGRVLDVQDTSTLQNVKLTIFMLRGIIQWMESAFLQLESIQNLHITFEVDFIHICDLARCCIHFVKVAMNENDFNKGLGKYLADDYYKVGIMISIALLQNGRLPKFARLAKMYAKSPIQNVPIFLPSVRKLTGDW